MPINISYLSSTKIHDTLRSYSPGLRDHKSRISTLSTNNLFRALSLDSTKEGGPSNTTLLTFRTTIAVTTLQAETFTSMAEGNLYDPRVGWFMMFMNSQISESDLSIQSERALIIIIMGILHTPVMVHNVFALLIHGPKINIFIPTRELKQFSFDKFNSANY